VIAEVPEIVVDSTAVLGLVIAAGTAISLLLGVLWKAFKLADQIHDMAIELKPNHGGSLRDQIDATRTMTEANAQSLESLAGKVQENADTMVHLRVDTEKAIRSLGETTDGICQSNNDAHAAIHRRVDGLFELLVGGSASAPRKTAARHQNREDPT
jgi:methyl-accepting chemotaxis protein